MTEDERHELAFAAAELLKARNSRVERRRALDTLTETLRASITHDRIVEVLDAVSDADYIFRGDPDRG